MLPLKGISYNFCKILELECKLPRKVLLRNFFFNSTVFKNNLIWKEKVRSLKWKGGSPTINPGLNSIFYYLTVDDLTLYHLTITG